VEPLLPEDLIRRALELREQLQPQLPEIDPGDLLLIVQSLLRPMGTGRRFFLRKGAGGGYVP
jgi:hypothetical protein